MACTDDGVDCTEVIDQIYEYLDGELDAERVELVQAHLERCGSCLQQYGLEQEVRALVGRACACRHAPDDLRQRILARITQIRVTATFGGTTAAATVTFHATEQPPR